MISVLVPVYNGSDFVLEQLDSIRTQTRAVDEVIVCDDGSTDGTPELVRAYVDDHSLRGWRVIQTPRNLGPAGNSLHLLQHAQGDLVFMADQDDVWEPYKVATMVEHLGRHPEAVALTATESLIDGDGEEITDASLLKRFGRNLVPFEGWKPLDSRDFVGYSSTPWHAMCVRKHVIATAVAAGAPDVGRTLGADWYVGLIASTLGEFHMLGTPLMRRRVHSSNASLGRLRRSTVLATHRERRIDLLDEVRRAHEFVMTNPRLRTALDDETRRALRRVVALQEARARFTRRPSPAATWALIAQLRAYRLMFGEWRLALRTLGADALYTNCLGRKSHA